MVSINLPISAQVVGARATRTTHPWVLERFRELFGAVIGEPVEVANPFIWKSKADVIRSIVERGYGPLIKHTVSCTRTYDITKLHTHCGCCSQCLDRRFAILAADATKHDPVEMYNVELLTGERDKPNDQTMAESYVRTALELRDMGELAFFGRYCGETARVCSGFPGQTADDVASRVMGLHQRHGQAIWDVLNAAVANHSAEIVDGSLRSSSLLMMAITRGATPVVSRPGEQADPLDALSDDESETAPSTRSRSRPALERALGAIRKLYPTGVPAEAAVPHKHLCQRVAKKLKQEDLPSVSNDTILRAAGRRK
jgi:hypothetical protein